MMRLLFVALAITLVSAKIIYKDCGNGEILDVSISGCDEKKTCMVHVGDNVTYTITFKANADSKTAFVNITGDILGRENGVPEDACKLGIACPIKKGEIKIFKNMEPIPSFAPNFKGELKAKLIGDDNKMLACVTTTLIIKKK